MQSWASCQKNASHLSLWWLICNCKSTVERAAAQSTRIEDTLDYADLANKVQTLIIDGKYLLIETLINDIADLCLSAPEASGVTVEVRKPKALANAIVGLRIYRAK